MPLSNPKQTVSIPGFSSIAQSRAPALRNLANADELNAWLQDLLASRFGSHAPNANEASLPPRQAACQRWLLSVARKWIARQGQTEQHNPSGNALIQSPAWIQQAVANGAPPQRLCLLSSERETLAGVLDWMRSDDGPALSSDWSRISVEQAIAFEKAWVDAMAKAALKKDLDAADAAGATLFADSPAPGPDGRFGWRWVQVHSSDALDREGALMRHCVGSYADDVASERKSIYSLRDPDNKPRLTLETQQGHIAQLKAFANQPCPPELYSRVVDFARAFESLCQAKSWTLQTSDEAEAAGLFAVPGLGLAIAGSPPPDKFSARFAADLEEPSPNVDALPLFAALGWSEFLQLAIPHASAKLRNQALINASGFGQLRCVELLLPHSDPTAKNSCALRWAAHNGHVSVARLLLPHSDPKANNSYALRFAAEDGHLSVVELLLPHSDPTADDSYALRWAAQNGHLAVVELLLPHSDPKANNSYALRWAAHNGHLAVAQLLLPHSDPKANNSCALRYAAEKGRLSIAQLLLPHSDPKADDSYALRWACSNGHLATAEFLLPHSDPKAGEGYALIMAADSGHLAVVQLLLPHSDPKAKDSQALILAARNGHLDIARLLLPHSDPKAKDSQAFTSAAHNGHLAVVELLLPHSDPKANNSQALLLAAHNDHISIVKLLLPFSPQNDLVQALEAARRYKKNEAAQLIQAAIDAQIPSPPPELDALSRKLAQERQRQSPSPSTGPAL